MSGKVVETNEVLVDNPEMLNESPFSDGWLVKMEVADVTEADVLVSANEYEATLQEQR